MDKDDTSGFVPYAPAIAFREKACLAKIRFSILENIWHEILHDYAMQPARTDLMSL
jgi:hypothetical protein